MSEENNVRESKHPELHEFMSNLREAGMHYERVIEHGFQFAEKLEWQKNSPAYAPVVLLTASQMVRDVANELRLSLKYQREAYEEAVWRAR